MAYKQQRRIFDFLLPFLIFVSLGVIIVLGFQLWQALKPQKLKSEAYLYLANGKAQILPWALDQWEPGINGSRILQGDSVKTSSQGKAVLKLYDGTIVRIGPRSELTIQSLDQDNQDYSANLKLQSGTLWIKTGKQRSGSSNIEIRTNHLNTVTKGTVFSITTEPHEEINLIKGNLEIEVITQEEEREKTAERIQLTTGKALNITPEAIIAYENHRSPQVIKEISPEFLSSEWYQWNIKEDENPTDFSKQPEIQLSNESSATPEISENQESKQEDSRKETPTITTPSENPLTTDKDTIRISGTAPTSAEKIIIITEENNREDPYTLRNFTRGDTTWNYTASSKFGNLNEGKNEYLIYAESKEGLRSKSTKLTIIYTPKKEEASTPNS